MKERYGFNWLGYGLELVSPDGKDVFLQGDEANNFYAELQRAINNFESSQVFETVDDLLDCLIEPYFIG